MKHTYLAIARRGGTRGAAPLTTVDMLYPHPLSIANDHSGHSVGITAKLAGSSALGAKVDFLFLSGGEAEKSKGGNE